MATGKSTSLADAETRVRPWIQGLAFAPNSKTLAVADTNGQLRVWDVAARKELHARNEHTGSIVQATASPDGSQVATAGGDGTVRIWNMATGEVMRSWVADDKRSVFSAEYSPDGRSLFTSGWDGSTRMWDLATGKEVRRFREGSNYGRAALSLDGKTIATSGPDGKSIVLFDAATGRKIREVTGHISLLSRLAFSPDGRRLISSADMHSDSGQHFDDRSIRVWDVASGTQIHKIDAGRPHGGMSISPDGRILAAATTSNGQSTNSLRFWDLASGNEIPDRLIKTAEAVAFAPNGRFLAVADHDIRLIEAATGRVVQSFETGAATVNGLSFTSDGRRLISAHNDGTALIWDLAPKLLSGVSADKLWDSLGSEDAVMARQAAFTLASDLTAVRILQDRPKPVAKPAEWRSTATLLKDLDDPMFRVREMASKAILERFAVVFADLADKQTTSPSPEVRKRIDEILKSAPSPWPNLTTEDLRRVRAVGVLEAIGTPDARKLLAALADGDPSAAVTRAAHAAVSLMPR